MSRVSYVMMNPGGAAALTGAVRDALRRPGPRAASTRPASSPRTCWTSCWSAIRSCTTSSSDSIRRRSAPRPFELATDEAGRHPCRRAGARPPERDRARPAVHRRPRGRRHRGRDAERGALPRRRRRSCSWTSAPTPRSCSVTATAVFAASSPTGPAFEGAQISCGQRATVGAIERVRIDRTTLAPTVRVIGADGWSDEPGFAATRAGGHGRVRLRHRQRDRRAVPRRRHRRRRHHPRATRPRTGPHVVPDGRTFAYVLHDDGVHPSHDHPERRARHPARQGRAARRDRPARRALRLHRPAPTSASPVRSAPTSIRWTRWCSVCSPTRRGRRCVRSATRPAPGAVRALVSGAQRAEIADRGP